MKIINATYTEEELAEAFPNIDPEFEPRGSRVLVQLRSPKSKSKGGIILTSETQETELWNTQIGLVRSLGPLAFKHRVTLDDWKEGAWVKVGDYCRVPKFLQDKWTIDLEDGKQVLFMLVNDTDILAIKTGNPLNVKAYI